jgi:hypothetical protein
MSVSWVGVRYRKSSLADIMKTMRLWLDHRRVEPKTFEYVISGLGVLVRLEFPGNAEAAEFAEAFGGEVSRDRPSIDGVEVNTAERQVSRAS